MYRILEGKSKNWKKFVQIKPQNKVLYFRILFLAERVSTLFPFCRTTVVAVIKREKKYYKNSV